MDVKTIAVIGAGPLGRSVAFIAARSGYKTVLEDVSDVRLEKATTWIAQQFALGASNGTAGNEVHEVASEELSTARTVEDAIRDADLILETLPEEMEMKIELFTILDKFAKPSAIFATAGAISIAELAEVTFCADRCVGMRFSEPVLDSKVVELVKSSETSGETIAACSKVAYRMGKEACVVDDLDACKSADAERKVAHAED
jgi:3-hydroxybutyryl-CoA dehydrogenase